MPLNCSQENLITVSQELYDKIEEKVEQDYFINAIGRCWYSATGTISALKNKDGKVILFQEFSLSNGKATPLAFKVNEEVFNLYNKNFLKK